VHRGATGLLAGRLRGRRVYEDFLAAINDPDHDEHVSMLEWVGGSFDPEAFDPADFEHRLNRGRLVAP
jgi:hypothetical protein